MPQTSTDLTSNRYPAPITDILNAQDAGRDACWAQQPTTSCPYRGSDPTTSFMRRMWLRGYLDARRHVMDSAT